MSYNETHHPRKDIIMSRNSLKMTAHDSRPDIRDLYFERADRRWNRRYNIGMLLLAITLITAAFMVRLPN